jgi:hypothetical protein
MAQFIAQFFTFYATIYFHNKGLIIAQEIPDSTYNIT